MLPFCRIEWTLWQIKPIGMLIALSVVSCH